jgi:orotate phosphoribosyltransferase
MEKLARLIREKAYLEGDFILRSGKHSSFYIDMKKALGDPEVLGLAADAIIKAMPNADKVCGIEVGAVPVAAVVSVKSKIPMLIARKEKKGYGTDKLIEGDMKKGDRVVVIEDTTTTGGQILKACESVESEGGTVVCVIVVVDREEGAREAIEGRGIRFLSLITLAQLRGMSD